MIFQSKNVNGLNIFSKKTSPKQTNIKINKKLSTDTYVYLTVGEKKKKICIGTLVTM